MLELRAMGELHRANPGQLALAWQLTKPFVSSVIVGATSQEQLEQNLAAADLRLTAEQTRTLDALTAPVVPYPGWMQPMSADAKLLEALTPTI